MKGSFVVAYLLLAALVGNAQDKTAVEAQNTPTRALVWNDSHDMKEWLTGNELALMRGDACTLTYHWFDERFPDGPSSATHPLVTFVVLPSDEESTRIIHDPQSGLDVRVGVRYSPSDSKSSRLLQIALAFEGPAAGVFDEVNRAEAVGLRYPGWRRIGVVKARTVEDERYTFSLQCEYGRSYLNRWQWLFSRSKPPKR